MSPPFIAIATLGIKDGRLEDFTRSYEEVVETVKEHEPRMIAFHGFVNEDGTEMTIIQVHPDAASMDFYMQVLSNKLGASTWPGRSGPSSSSPGTSSTTGRPALAL
jgi:hypothetical protein